MKKPNEPTKQKRASDLCGLLYAAICTATVGKRSLSLMLLLSLLMLTMMAVSPSASAQTVNTGKNGTGTTSQPDSGASPAGSRGITGSKGYFQRFPYAQAANKADTLKTDPSTGVSASAAGTTSTQSAYQTVMKMCDEGYGIAYMQIPMVASDKPAAARDSELFQNLMTTFGYPVSDSQFQIIQRENNQRLLELAYDPERVMWMTSTTSQTTSSQASKSMANTGELALTAVFNYIVNGDGNGSLINVANEGAVSGLTYRGNGDDVSIAMAVSMVQTMYKLVFIPMAVLFLLPGAVISQVKSMTAKGFGMQATESQSPFDGILRSIVAVFLIPATQVIVSWSIDTGNSLAYSCREWVDLPTIMNWTQQLCYDPKLSINAILPPNPGGSSSSSGSSSSGGGLGSVGSSIGGAIGGSLGAAIGGFLGGLLGGGSLGGYGGTGDGLAANQPDTSSVIEQQDWMGQALQTTLNGAMLMAAITLIILTALQVVTLCYLLLLGPISAAFYAWPQVSSTHLFRGVFGKWVDGVIKVSMWRFVWMAILAIMTQRIIYMGGMPTDLKWEAAVFICFLGLMVGVPASPFTFQPYTAFQSARQLQTQSATTQQGVSAGQNGSPGGQTPAAGQGGAGTQGPSGASPGGQPAGQPGGHQHDGQTQSPPNAGGSGASNTKDAPHGAPPPSQSGQPANGQGTPGGVPAGPGGNPTGVGGAPPPGGGTPPGGGNPPGGGTPAGGSGNGSPAGVNASMPSASPAVALTPPAGATPSSPATISNPGAPPAAPAAPAAPAPAGGSADSGGDEKGSGAKPAAAPATAGGAAPDAGSAIAQVASAAGSAPPPASPAKNDDGK
jgi:hypothetical protein